MRSTLFAAAALVLATGCAHQSEMHETTTVVNAPRAEVREAPPGEIIAVDQQSAPEEAPRARPKLTQTITLGQSNAEATYSAPAPTPGQQGQGGSSQNVTVNNNVIVNQSPAVYGGWGGYGGYGYGYSGRGYGVRSDGFGRSGSSRGATWGNTGWEGARGRPAAPGATPGVGGNWAPAPSYGPSQMK